MRVNIFGYNQFKGCRPYKKVILCYVISTPPKKKAKYSEPRPLPSLSVKHSCLTMTWLDGCMKFTLYFSL